MSDDIESKALGMGWVPQEKFKGDIERWVDAPTFVEKGEIVLPILKKKNEKLQSDVATLSTQLAETRAQVAEAQEALNAFKEYQTADSKRQFDRALERLKAEKVQALENSDHASVVELDEAISELKASAKDKDAPALVTKKVEPKVDATQQPEYQAWLSENKEWFEVDREKTAYAISQGHFIRMTNPTVVGTPFFDLLTEAMEEKYGAPSRRVDKMEGSRSGSSSKKGGKSYNDLPSDARAACDRFSEKLVGPGKSFKTESDWRKHYATQYFGDES